MSCDFEPSDQIVNHFTEEKLIDWFSAGLVWCFESQLIVAIDGRLPEELHEASEVEEVVLIWLQKLGVDLSHQLLELVLCQH